MIVTRPGLLRTFSITAVAAVFVGQSIVGITWGLPSRKIDKYLFGDGEVWSGEKIYRLAKAEAKFDPTRGADVDVDPLNKRGDEPIPLTATEEDVAKIYLRYRLYTYQPDEMITMMALAGMRPSRLELDPRLYQYGGLFVYPVGALIKLCGVLGLINVRSDVVFYLDHPDEFGKFYIVARAYSAVWGLIGVLVVYAIAKRLAIVRTPSASAGSTATTVGSVAESGPLPPGRGSEQAHRAGLLAALLFTLMPVVVCMSHEGKPHLPGAVLMLLAVYFAMRCAEPGNAIVEDRRSKIERNTAGADVGNRQSAILLVDVRLLRGGRGDGAFLLADLCADPACRRPSRGLQPAPPFSPPRSAPIHDRCHTTILDPWNSRRARCIPPHQPLHPHQRLRQPRGA